MEKTMIGRPYVVSEIAKSQLHCFGLILKKTLSGSFFRRIPEIFLRIRRIAEFTTWLIVMPLKLEKMGRQHRKSNASAG
jgi:hypothetical protein